ncbi:hypothetical protein [Jiella sp. M17.18]|uniref:hypothetical protein n=1 Tax=Jiella sp. M17.18 TaxID=3234247 RepID=UPI0034DE25BA
MGGSKFIPIVIAGLVGLFIGWLISPNVGSVNRQVTREVDQLKKPIADIQTNVQQLNSGLSQQADQTSAGVKQAVGGLQQEIAKLGNEVQTRTDALMQAVQKQGQAAQASQNSNDMSQKLDQIAQALQGVQQSVQQLGQRPAASGGGNNGGQAGGSQAGGDPAALANQIGPSGAILLPGQAAIFGGQTVQLSGLASDGQSATIGISGRLQSVQPGASVSVAGDCQVTVAGIAAGAAYLSANGCGGGSGKGQQQAAGGNSGSGQQGAAAGNGQQAAANGNTRQGTAQQNVSAGGQQQAAASPGAGQQANAGAAGGQQPAATSATVPVGGVANFGQTKIFVSAIGDNAATLLPMANGAAFPQGGTNRQTVTVGSSMDAGNGCQVTLKSIDNDQASLAAAGCNGGNASGSQAAAPAGDNQSGGNASSGSAGNSRPAAGNAQQQAASGGQQQGNAGSQQAQPSGQQASATSATVSVGSVANFGQTKIFVSAIGDNQATLLPMANGAAFPQGGADRQVVRVGSSMDAGNGCQVTLKSVDNDQASLTSQGCNGGASGSPAGAAQPASGQQQMQPASGNGAGQQSGSNAQPNGVASGQPTNQQPANGAAAQPAGGQQQSSNGNGSGGLQVGETQNVGNHMVFLSAINDNAATIYVMGAGRQQVKAGSSADLGNGCSVKVDRVQDGRAYLLGSGC